MNKSINKADDFISQLINSKEPLNWCGYAKLMEAWIYIVQVQGQMSGMKTLPHSAAITSVDWHPTLDMFITGSADHSVRVTSIIWILT